MQGVVPEALSGEDRVAMVKQFWKHDIYCTSKLLKDKVLVVSLLNDLSCFTPEQYHKLAADIALVKEKGWIFSLKPIATRNRTHTQLTGGDAIQADDHSAFPDNYCGGDIAGGSNSDAATETMYQLIINSANEIKGFFAGHIHSHMYLEISAKLPDGTPAVIPQYSLTATAYQGGQAIPMKTLEVFI